MVNLKEDEWLRDVSLLIVAWIVILLVAGLLLIFVGGAVFG